MRLFIFSCFLLASVVVASPNGRHKRNLAYLRNLITSAIFGGSQNNIQPTPVLLEENGYKQFRLRGNDDVMIYPALGKVNLNAFGTLVGTKSNDDTLVAVKEVDNLLSTGILQERHNNVMKESIVPMFSSINTPNYIVEEKIKTAPVIETRPVITEVIDNSPVFTEVIENRPVLAEVIRPLEEKVELKVPFESTYSYKQIRNNEPVMMYTAYNNPGVELVETIKTKTELPTYVNKRVDEAIVLGADPNRFAPQQEIFQYQSPPVFDFSFPRLEGNSYVHNSFREDVSPVLGVFQYQTPPGGNSVVSNGTMKQMKAVPIAGSKDNVANAKIPDIGKVVKESNALKTNEKANTNQNINAPAVNSVTAKKDIAPVKNVVYTNNVTAKPQSVTPPVVEASTKAHHPLLSEYIRTSILNKPIVGKDNNKKKNADSSSKDVNGNRDGVSVNVKEHNNRGRGDIPDQ